MIKNFVRQVVGEPIAGFLDYYRYPERRGAWGGPFNAQEFRMALFDELMQRLPPLAIVETGTHLGTTTEYLAATGRPVFTIERDQRIYGFAKARLRKHRNVTLLQGDSRRTLSQLLEGPLASLAGETLFFYLDAHWEGDLPLAQELDIIFSRCPNALVMVDDFQVPHDPGYGYDEYGPDSMLTADYIAAAVGAHGLAGFYPSIAAIHESGARRGCIILARMAVHGNALASIPLLVKGDRESAGADVLTRIV